MSEIKLFNSRSKKYETLEEEKVGMYMCGPTVYGKVHIGNLRTFLFGDVVYRTLKYFGKNVKYVMNITDVDDKIIKLVSNMDELYTLTNKYETLFKNDLIQLNVLLPEFHRVSDNMKNIQNLIHTLLNNGSAYETEDGSVYYDTSKNDKICSYFDIHLNDDNYHSNREIVKSEGVKNKNDFVLWKSRQSETKFKEKNIFWNDTSESSNSFPSNSSTSDSSPLKSGRPGWHIECSAIAMDSLGKVTLHLGGEDLKFPHHTNEIAQSESACTELFGKYWMHVSFLNLEHNEKEEKMSKSLGNVVYLENLTDKYNPLVIRMYLNSKNYQRTFTFSLEELNLYVDRLSDIYRTIVRLNNFIKNKNDMKSNLPKDFLENFEKEILKPIYDNFNIGAPLEILEKKFTMIRKPKNINFKDANSLLELFNKLDTIFGILNPDLFLIDKETQEKIQERDSLRENKEYTKADNIRLNIQENYIFEDDSTGYIIFKKI